LSNLTWSLPNSNLYIFKIIPPASGVLPSSAIISGGSANIFFQNGLGVNLSSLLTTTPNPSLWQVTLTSTSLTVVYPTSFTGMFTNFRRLTGQAGGIAYLTAAISVGSTTGNYCSITPSTYTFLIANVNNTNSGLTTFPIYFSFEYSSFNIIF
jgi:hypothetical protein